MAAYRMTLSQTRMEFLHLQLQQPKLYLGICIIIIIPDESTFLLMNKGISIRLLFFHLSQRQLIQTW